MLYNKINKNKLKVEELFNPLWIKPVKSIEKKIGHPLNIKYESQCKRNINNSTAVVTVVN